MAYMFLQKNIIVREDIVVKVVVVIAHMAIKNSLQFILLIQQFI